MKSILDVPRRVLSGKSCNIFHYYVYVSCVYVPICPWGCCRDSRDSTWWCSSPAGAVPGAGIPQAAGSSFSNPIAWRAADLHSNVHRPVWQAQEADTERLQAILVHLQRYLHLLLQEQRGSQRDTCPPDELER